MSTEPRASISPRDLDRFRDCALQLAGEARAMLHAFCANGFEAKRKQDGSYVTNADIEIEQRLRAIIEREFPDHGIVGEELPPHRPGADFQWIFDPVDGTEDFVQRIPTFGSIIGLHFHGEPVAGVIDVPLLDTRGWAVFSRGTFVNGNRIRLVDLPAETPPGQTRVMLAARANFARHGEYGGAAFDLLTRGFPNHRIYRTCYAHLCAASGQVDAMIEFGNKIWDLAAARILAEEAGGAYRAVETIKTAEGTLLAAVFGKPSLVARLGDMFEKIDR